MNPTGATVASDETTTCCYCGKEAADGRWFARLRQGSRRVIFCRSRCLELYLRESEGQEADDSVSDWPQRQDQE